MSQDNDGTFYQVVVNHEEQYSIWPVHMAIPAGWREVGKTGSKADVLAFIEQVWTDMRPLSVRGEPAARPSVSAEMPGDDERCNVDRPD